ncbi:MAG: ABC transporter permease [Saprospiraceae bacterium]|nr:ABC transporter permease [Saprospiraceae bacterium]
MFLIAKISYRYLFGKKSSQAIHWISGISIIGISVGTAALILVLSVFNGFEGLLSGLFSKYNPDIKIISKLGKTFPEDPEIIKKLHQIPGVLLVSRTLEEVAMFQYGVAQEFGILKGVDSNYVIVCAANSAVLEGAFVPEKEGVPLANIGIGIRNKLGVNLENFEEAVNVFVPNHEEAISIANFPKKYPLQAQSVYTFHQEADYSNIITGLSAVRFILNKPSQLSSIEIKIDPKASFKSIVLEIEKTVGSKYVIKDRYKQDEAFLKIMKLEKWLFYALFCLTLLLVSFTVVGALWMIVLEKRMDISVLKSMGMTDLKAKQIFIQLGLLICWFGLLFGYVLAGLFYFLQKQYEIIGVPEDFMVDSYPIEMHFIDFLLVGITVMIIGLLASFLPAKKVNEILPIFREE